MTEREKYKLFTQLKDYLLKQGYYVGDSGVAEVLRNIADYWDD